MANMTVSGNEITDVVRAANIQGDGATIPGGYGVWRATTNLFRNGNADTNLTDWFGSGITLIRDTTVAKFGTTSVESVCPGGSSGQGFHVDTATGQALSAGTAVRASVWLKGNAGGETFTFFTRILNTDASSTDGGVTTITLTTSWQRFVATLDTVAVGKTGDQIQLFCSTNVTQVATFWAGGAQAETRLTATPYVDTVNATASRSVGQVQGLASLLNATQSWVAVRCRPEWDAASDPLGNGDNPTVFEWAVDASNRLRLSFAPLNNSPASVWYADRQTGGAGAGSVSAVQTFTSGQAQLAIFRCTATQAGISVNGGAFVNQANTSIPNLSSITLFDIGTGGSAQTGHEWDGEILWVTGGTGTLTDADAATLNGYGLVLPSLSQITAQLGVAASPTFAWPAATSLYNTFQTPILIVSPIVYVTSSVAS